MKRFGGEIVTAGSVLVRQRGTKFYPGRNVGLGTDDTLFAKVSGRIQFEWKRGGIRQISVYPVSVSAKS